MDGPWMTFWYLHVLPALPYIVAAVACTLLLGWSPLGRGWKQRAKPDSLDEVSARKLFAEVGALRQELAEVHERLDYAERIMASADRDVNPPPITRRNLTPV